MGRYSVNKGKRRFMKTARIPHVVYPVKRSDIKRWYERARSMDDFELLYIISDLSKVFTRQHPQLIVYKKVAGIAHVDKLSLGVRHQITEMLSAKAKAKKAFRQYAKDKNRMIYNRKAIDWNLAFSMNTAKR